MNRRTRRRWQRLAHVIVDGALVAFTLYDAARAAHARAHSPTARPVEPIPHRKPRA